MRYPRFALPQRRNKERKFPWTLSTLNLSKPLIRTKIDTAIAKVLEHGRYIFGPEIAQFEADMAAFGECQTCAVMRERHRRSCFAANGHGHWPVGDAVFCPSFTFAATAEAVALRGATPVFVDIDRDTYNMCPTSLQTAIDGVSAKGELTPKAVIAVDLFGQPADYPKIAAISRNHGLKLIADTAQGFGGTLGGKHPLHWADISTTSFFPAKPLGCYGDGGAMLTNDDELAHVIDSLRNHGKGTDRYDNVRIGLNSRLDTIQAAILIEKLGLFAGEIDARMKIAARYNRKLAGGVARVPALIADCVSTWAQYTIEVDDRDKFMAHMKEAGVPTASYYPRPVHKQTAYEHYPIAGNGLANTEACMDKVVALPMSAYLSRDDQDKVIAAALSF